MNHSKNPFDLYQSVSGWERVSWEIEAAIVAARNAYFQGTKTAKEAYKGVKEVLNKYADWGACDSEPQWAAVKAFCKNFDDLDPSEFYFS